MNLKITFLGTGTSHGIPAIGCTCAVCTSSDARNRRRRSALYVEAGGTHVVIDTPPDFREQVLSCGVKRVDAVLLTHTHADHIFGFDDLRRFSYLQKMRIPVYGSESSLAEMRSKFDYVIKDSFWKPSVPQVEFRSMPERFMCGAIEVEPFEAPHGPMTVNGFVLRHGDSSLAYLPDCSAVSDALIERLMGVDVMILDGLRRKPHPTHLCLLESVAALQSIQAGASYLTHLCHDLEHAETQAELPETLHVAYDGLVVHC